MTPTRSDIRIGISGWTYAPWRGTFYPAGLPHSQELAYASRQVNSIEVNGSFYSLQSPETYRRWFLAAPEDFVFSIKASRYITHMLRLREIERALLHFLDSGPLELGEKLGPILWQFPPDMKYDAGRFDEFLRLLERHAPGLRHAVEVRNETFRDRNFFSCLRSRGVACVVSDSSGAWPMFEELTAGFVYVRLHGEGELYSGGYGERALNLWAAKIRRWTRARRDVFVYFDNDSKVRAPFDAIALAGKLTRARRATAA
jgi:uncharacterized protein YecE (DUF72 family)